MLCSCGAVAVVHAVDGVHFQMNQPSWCILSHALQCKYLHAADMVAMGECASVVSLYSHSLSLSLSTPSCSPQLMPDPTPSHLTPPQTQCTSPHLTTHAALPNSISLRVPVCRHGLLRRCSGELSVIMVAVPFVGPVCSLLQGIELPPPALNTPLPSPSPPPLPLPTRASHL